MRVTRNYLCTLLVVVLVMSPIYAYMQSNIPLCTKAIRERPCALSQNPVFDCEPEIEWVEVSPGIGYWKLVDCGGFCDGINSMTCLDANSYSYCKDPAPTETLTTIECPTKTRNCGRRVSGGGACFFLLLPGNAPYCDCPDIVPDGQCDIEEYDPDSLIDLCSPVSTA